VADSLAFDHLCSILESNTSLDRLEARGTVRLTAKCGGLDARKATADQLCVLVEKLLPAELESRGVEGSETVCAQALEGLRSLALDAGGAETPETIFDRLGGG
jgi:hypothetical protein